MKELEAMQGRSFRVVVFEKEMTPEWPKLTHGKPGSPKEIISCKNGAARFSTRYCRPIIL